MQGTRVRPFIQERYRSDPEFALRLDYAAERGIPYSRFLEWDPDDQIYAVAWLTEQRITCSQCGTRPEEWDPKKGGDRNAYFPRAEPCPGCKLLYDAAEADKENAKKSKGDNPHRPWMKFRLIPKLEVKAEQFRRRFWGGYEPEPDPRQQTRRFKDGSSEGGSDRGTNRGKGGTLSGN